MSAVTVQEIVEALRNKHIGNFNCHALANRIQKHGIAPPDGLALVKAKPVGYTAQSSLDDLAREECSGVIMGSYSERYHRTIPIYAATEAKP